jgi:hypothetical protein
MRLRRVSANFTKHQIFTKTSNANRQWGVGKPPHLQSQCSQYSYYYKSIVEIGIMTAHSLPPYDVEVNRFLIVDCLIAANGSEKTKPNIGGVQWRTPRVLSQCAGPAAE